MDTEELIHQFRNLADKYAPAKANREYLEEYKKSLLALLMKDAEKKGFSSATAQEREARADPRYIEQLEVLKQAVHDEEKLRYHMKATEIEIEVWRTREASARTERRMYGA
jgi:hypothetical protein